MIQWVLLLVACGGRGPALEPAYEDAAALLQAARDQTTPFALRARLALHVESEPLDLAGTVRGGLLLHQPRRFRVELNGPVGGPLFLGASDGDDLSFYIAPSKRFYTGQAEEAVPPLVGDGMDLADLVGLLVARPPFADRAVVSIEEGESGPIYSFDAPQGGTARLEVDRRLMVITWLEGRAADGTLLLSARYDDFSRTGGLRLPQEAVVELPELGTRAQLRVDDWEELGRIPEVFTLDAPPGVEVVDLLAALTPSDPEDEGTPEDEAPEDEGAPEGEAPDEESPDEESPDGPRPEPAPLPSPSETPEPLPSEG